jgi:ABC-type transport system substrate-binding protein
MYYHLANERYGIISPSAHNKTSVNTIPLVGTGPFKITSENWTEVTRFERFEEYWRGPADIAAMEWIYVEGDYSRTKGILGGPGDRLYDMVRGIESDLYENISNDDTLVVESESGTVYFYIGFNTKEIPINQRKAMAYAFNHSALTNYADRPPMLSPIIQGMLYSRSDLKIPYLNLTLARQYMIYADAVENDTLDEIDLGNLTLNSSDEEWIERAQSDPILTYNFSYWQAFGIDDIAYSLISDMKLIGIKIEAEPMTGGDLRIRFDNPENFNWIRLFFAGWGSDFLDPHNMIGSALEQSPIQVDDPTFWNLVDQGLEAFNTENRKDFYYEMQELLCEDIVPWIQLFTGYSKNLHTNELSNFHFKFGMTYFYHSQWNPVSIDPWTINGYLVFIIIGVVTLIIPIYSILKRKKIN